MKSQERRSLSELSPEELIQREEARAALRYPPVHFTGIQARAIAQGFAEAKQAGDYTFWALAIMPEHAHIVIARHRFKVEQIANLRCCSEPGKLPRAYKIGPRSSRIIRQPEAIRRQDQVIAVDHGKPPKFKSYRANPPESISASPAARR